jgi:hypothetical protein
LEENKKKTGGSAHWACVAHLSFCFKKLYTEPSYQIVANVATRFQRRFFLEITRNKNCLCWPCLSTDQEEMNNFNRGPSIDPANQALVHLAKWFQRRWILKYRPIRIKYCLWWPCL